MTQDGTDTKHEWVQIQFSWGSWIECRCGYRPESQKDMDNHIKPTVDLVMNFGYNTDSKEVFGMAAWAEVEEYAEYYPHVIYFEATVTPL